MEKVFDAHVHYSFYIPIKEMVEIFQEEFVETGTEKFCFLSLPHHADGKERLYLTAEQNIKGLYLKHKFAPNAYAFAGLVHPQEKISNEKRADLYLEQVKEYFNAGYDGIKMLEGHPTLRRVMGIALDDKVYDKFYAYLEDVQMPVVMHVADPEDSWNMDTASEDAKALGRIYGEDYLTKRQLTDEVFNMLGKHPKLKFGLAHFGFMGYDIDEAERFLSYKNTFFDLTPGGEQFIKMTEKWGDWLSFFQKHQDRIIYGTDYYAFPKTNEKEWRTAFHRRPDFVRQFFETDGEYKYLQYSFKGVKIDKEIRDKIYRENFLKMLGQPKKINKEYYKNEIQRLLKNLPSGNTYYTKDGIVDISIPENKDKITKKYISDLNVMLEEIDKKDI